MRLNLIIDGNYILHKNVFSLHRLKALHGDLGRALVNNVKKFKSMGFFEKTFFVSDSQEPSWRKAFYPEYKGKRIKSDEIDWSFVFKAYAQFKEALTESGIATVIEGNGIEGDDWIAALTRKSNKMGIGVLTVSADTDLLQLIKSSPKNNWLNMQVDDYNGRERIYLPNEYGMFITNNEKSTDLFDLPVNDTVFDLNAITSMWQPVTVDPNEKLFKKLVEGDKKTDNIASIYHTPQNLKDGGTRLIGIGASTSEVMWNHYCESGATVSHDDIPVTKDVIRSLEVAKSITLTPEQRNLTLNNLSRNIKLIHLHHRYLPESKLKIMSDTLSPYFSETIKR